MMILQAVPLSDDEIRCFSFGRVKNPLVERTYDWREEKGSVFDPAIFGCDADWRCACGKYSGEQREDMICDICGAKVGVAELLRRQRFGHINLPIAVPHPIGPDYSISAVPVLPIAFRTRERGGADLNALYVGLVQTCLEIEDGAARSREQAAEQVSRKLSELYCNDLLEHPRTWRGRPLGSLSYSLVEDPVTSAEDVGTLLRALGLKLRLRPESW
jgi:hypothetical protein